MVMQGQLVGYIGSTGNSTGPHFHLAPYHDGDAEIGGTNFAELAWPSANTKNSKLLFETRIYTHITHITKPFDYFFCKKLHLIYSLL